MEQDSNISKTLYGLFYWRKNNQYIFSRSKFLTLMVFIVIFIYGLEDLNIITAFLIGLFFAVPIYIIGLLIHEFADIDSSFYSGNLAEDLKHFLFYWYGGQNKFTISKTKLITIIIIAIGLLSGLKSAIPGQNSGEAFANTVISLMVAVPAFLIGYVIHNKNNQNDFSKSSSQNINKETISDNTNNTTSYTNFNDNSSISPNYVNYVLKAKELKKEYDEKELKTKELINAKFIPPQITNDRFMEVVENCSKLFNNQYTSILNIINFTKEDSIRLDEEIDSKINIMESLIEKLDDLSSELVIQMSKTKNDDIHAVLNDMENLISSINNYEE